MEIFRSKYQLNEFDKTNSLFIFRWVSRTATGRMGDAEFKSEMLEYVHQVEAYKPHKLLIDNLNLDYLISPKMQDWINENIFLRVIGVGLRKVAILVTPDFIAQLGVEQVMETGAAALFQTKYFDDETKAKNWLLQ